MKLSVHDPVLYWVRVSDFHTCGGNLFCITDISLPMLSIRAKVEAARGGKIVDLGLDLVVLDRASVRRAWTAFLARISEDTYRVEPGVYHESLPRLSFQLSRVPDLPGFERAFNAPRSVSELGSV